MRSTLAAQVRARLMVIGALALMPAIAATVYIQSAERTAARERVARENLRIVRLAASKQAGIFDGMSRLLATVAKFPPLGGSDPAPCRDLLARVIADHPGYYNVVVTNRDGSLFCSGAPLDVARWNAGPHGAWLDRAVQAGGPAVGDYQASATSGNPAMVVARPMLDDRGRVWRVIAASLALDQLVETAEGAELPGGSTLTLFDRNGTILARVPNGTAWIGKHVPTDPVIRPTPANDAATAEAVGVDGVKRLYATVPVVGSFDTGLFLGVGVDEATAFAAVNRTFFRYLWLLGIIALGSVGAAVTVGNLLVVRPMETLSEATRRTADELRETEGRYRQLFEVNPHPMWVFDRLTLEFLEVNEAAVRTYGYSRDEFRSMRISDIRPAEDLPKLQANLAENREPWARRGGWRHRLKSGRVIDVEITSHLFTFAGRDAELVTVVDATDRVRAEAALAERSVLTALTADVGVALNLPQGRQRCLQRCAEAIVAHLEARTAAIWTCDAVDAPAIEACAGDGPSAPPELVARVAAGQRHVVEGDFALYPLSIGAKTVGVITIGGVSHVSEAALIGLASLADVVALGIERHRGERAIYEAEERLRFALDAAQIGVWEANLRTGAAYWSPRCEQMHGREPGTFGRNMDAFLVCVAPDDRARIAADTEAALRDHRNPDLEYDAVWPDGTVHRITSKGQFVYDADGSPLRGAGVCVDITERRSLELQLRQSQKMEAIGQLAGGIAHDFNNLLTAIQGFAAMLAESLPSDDPRCGDVEEIQRAGERAADLTRQLLAFSRKQILSIRVVHVGDVVASLTPMLRRLLGEPIDLRTTTGDRSCVKADPGQLEQVVLNLAVNARDAMDGAGRLTIETSDVTLDEDAVRRHPEMRAGRYVMLAVTDNGCGMDESTQRRIFEPFFTTKPKDRGTGLGLATVYGIIRQSGGFIWVYSEVGRGTTFKIYLPRTDEAPEQRTAPGRADLAAGTESVLVVEDEGLVREYVYKALSRRGYRVHAVETPEHAIEYAQAQRATIDAIVTDVVLPGLSGPAMIARLREHHPEARVLYMSGYADRSIVDLGMLETGAPFLQKPFSADGLARKLRDVLDDTRLTVWR